MSTDADRPDRDVFVPGIGQYENIGDIILRRQLLRWLRPLGRLHVYIGRAPSGYAEGLTMSNADLVYGSFRKWYGAALRCAWRGKASYIFKPGEIQLTLVGLKEHVAMLPLALLIRLRGGAVVRVGAGARNFSWLPRLIMRPSLAMTQRVWWRDARTASYLGGEVMPDLAFGEGDEHPRKSAENRDILVVSMRGDQRGVSEEWIEGVRAYAARNGLGICAVTQVERDAGLARELARKLGGSLVEWEGGAHDDKEADLNAVYRRARVAVSDRLHVLIAAYIHGATPVALQMNSSDKIRRHFQVVGVDGISHDCSRLDRREIEGILGRVEAGAEVLHEALPPARARLEGVRRELARLVGGRGGRDGGDGR